MDRGEVVESLRGQTINVTNLDEPFQDWPSEINPEIDRLRRDVDEWLQRTMSHSGSLELLKISGFALFGATWWPRAEYHRLKIATYLAIWLFTWDDEIDSAAGSLHDDFETAQRFRTETLDYVQLCLGPPSSQDSRAIKPSNQIICNFKEIGESIRDAYSIGASPKPLLEHADRDLSTEQSRRVFKEMTTFMQMSEKEQRLRLSGTLPSIKEFWKYRLGSSAVAVCLSVNEYVVANDPGLFLIAKLTTFVRYAWTHMDLPKSIMDHPDMSKLWDQTNIIISTVNDVLSLKKEIARGAIDSLIPLLYAKTGDVQAAVDELTIFLIKTIKSFEETAQKFPAQVLASDAKSLQALQNFIDGCRYYCTGNLRWR
ncbi:MAG: hypothetical protein M1828_002505 [Chrysothrix sp. TS-e1954]|nr:MAG: hypothetical protein M1828_002505 [Chrysothrix sp. TS-e1954]